MGFFDQAKLLSNLIKNMDPSQMKELMEQAKQSQKMMEEIVRRIVKEELDKVLSVYAKKDWVEENFKKKNES
ncbi:hypothetical protein HRbin34_00317 [bacterium HR34]|nr:hypothetical protein HRbin34_00317 [bacterium HR34]